MCRHTATKRNILNKISGIELDQISKRRKKIEEKRERRAEMREAKGRSRILKCMHEGENKSDQNDSFMRLPVICTLEDHY